jgi:RNA polymerase sigma-70 factor (ECF subfamily)
LLERVRGLKDPNRWEESWNEFVDLYGPVILRSLRKVGVPPQDADDLAQDVFQIVVRRIRSFEYDAGLSFRAWLRTLAKHRAYRYFAQQGRRPPAPGGTSHLAALQEIAEPGDQDLDAFIEVEWRKRRWELAQKQVRQEVTEKTWQAFELRYVQNLDPTEIAQRLNMKVGAVYTNISRVLKRLREAVEEIDGSAS